MSGRLRTLLFSVGSVAASLPGWLAAAGVLAAQQSNPIFLFLGFLRAVDLDSGLGVLDIS